jgi:hypothetical protein
MTDTKYVRMWLVENDKRGAPALQYRSANQPGAPSTLLSGFGPCLFEKVFHLRDDIAGQSEAAATN